MHTAVEFLLARPQADAHDFFEAGVFEFLAKLIAFFGGGQRGHDAVQEVDVSGQVVRSVPFDAADIRRSWDGRVFAREMSRDVGMGSLRDVWIGNDICMVQEYPKDLFSYVSHFPLPHAVWS